MDEKIKQSLIDIVGEKNYTDDLIDMVSYSYDGSQHKHRPGCAVWPETAQQVSELLMLANNEMTPVIPRGGGNRAFRNGNPCKGRHRSGSQPHEPDFESQYRGPVGSCAARSRIC